MDNLDIVYFVKPDLVNNELRYSLRSVEKNFPSRKVIFYGGQPIELIPDMACPVIQHGQNRYEKVRNMLRAACENDEITEDFWLFNDDFFVLSRVRSEKPFIRGTLQSRIKDIEAKQNGMTTAYSRQLRRTMHILKINGYQQLDYALHVPMLINRSKALEVINAFPDSPMFRSLYGNYWDLGGTVIDDVKIQNNAAVPEDAKYLSTDDNSFSKCQAGDYLRSRFTKPSKYESGA